MSDAKLNAEKAIGENMPDGKRGSVGTENDACRTNKERLATSRMDDDQTSRI